LNYRLTEEICEGSGGDQGKPERAVFHEVKNSAESRKKAYSLNAVIHRLKEVKGKNKNYFVSTE
jgi:hypothetical protein